MRSRLRKQGKEMTDPNTRLRGPTARVRGVLFAVTITVLTGCALYVWSSVFLRLREETRGCLGRLGSAYMAKDVSAIGVFATDKDMPSEVKMQAMRYLREFGPHAVPFLEAAAEKENSVLAAFAVDALATIRNKEATEALLRLCEGKPRPKDAAGEDGRVCALIRAYALTRLASITVESARNVARRLCHGEPDVLRAEARLLVAAGKQRTY